MIHTIETLPFVTFIKIIETDNYYLLLKDISVFLWVNKLKVKFFKLDLEKAFKEIKEEYNENENSIRQKKIKSLKKKLDKLTSKYQVILLALEVLKRGKDDEMLAILKEHGYELQEDNYTDSILLIYRQIENLKNQIKAVSKELEDYVGADDDDDKKVRPQNTLVNIIVGLEISLSVNEITVIEYLCYKKAFAEKIKRNKKK